MIRLRSVIQRLNPVLYPAQVTACRRVARCKTAQGAAAAPVELEVVAIENPKELNFILGHAHFIQTCDDLAEICSRQGVPKFGAAFCEASEGHPAMPGRKVRSEGSDSELQELAALNAMKLGAGHTFVVFMDGAFPVSVLNAIKAAPTVCRVHCATSNPTSVIVAKRGEERKGILGVIDGVCPVEYENEGDKHARKEFLRTIGYKR